MGCIYCDFHGKCSMHDPEYAIDGLGCDDDGNCNCESDPDPGYSCDTYETDDPEDDDEEEDM